MPTETLTEKNREAGLRTRAQLEALGPVGIAAGVDDANVALIDLDVLDQIGAARMAATRVIRRVSCRYWAGGSGGSRAHAERRRGVGIENRPSVGYPMLGVAALVAWS